MSLVKIGSLAEHGIVSDIAAFELGPNAWTDAINVTFDGKQIQKIGKQYDTKAVWGFTPGPTISQGFRYSYGAIGTDGSYRLYGTLGPKHGSLGDGILALHNGSYWANINMPTPPVTAGMPTVPVIGKGYYGSWAYINGYIYHGDDASHATLGPMVVRNFTGSYIDDWAKFNAANDTPWTCRKFVGFNGQLVAINTTENGVRFPTRLKWSAISNNTVSNGKIATFNPGRDTTAGWRDTIATSELLDIAVLGNSLMIYTANEILEARVIGGKDMYKISKSPVEVGILRTGCVANIPKGHVVITGSDIVLHNGQTFVSIIDNKIKDRLVGELKTANPLSISMIVNSSNSELWILYNTGQTTSVCNKAAIYNYKYKTWTFREVPTSAHINYVRMPQDDGRTIDTMTTQNIDDSLELIDVTGADFARNSIVAFREDGSQLLLEEGQDFGGTTSPAFVERVNLDFDDLGLTPDGNKLITAIHPQIEGTGVIYISIGTADSPRQRPKWQAPVMFDAKKDYKADFREQGRYISIRFQSLDNNPWSLYNYSIDIRERGGFR